MSRRSCAPMVVAGFWMSLLLGSGPPILSVDDAIRKNDEPVSLAAYVERESVLGLRRDVEHVSVVFSVGDQTLGRATSDDEGRAAVTTRLPAGDSETFTVTSRVDGQALQATGRIFRWTAGRIILVVDIDQTIARTDFDKLLVGDKPTDYPPLPGAQETLSRLGRDYYVLYLTARPRFLLDKTRAWLDEQKFPAGPVLTSPRLRDLVRQSHFKRKLLADLRRCWPDMLIGIGNQESDAQAYAANQMLPLIVTEDATVRQAGSTIVFRNWQAVAEFFERNREILADPGKVTEVVRGQRMIPQSVVTSSSQGQGEAGPASRQAK